ncbi:MAG: hypothetical protein QW559_00110 [Candidatus Woesearchaeota archaeon]
MGFFDVIKFWKRRKVEAPEFKGTSPPMLPKYPFEEKVSEETPPLQPSAPLPIVATPEFKHYPTPVEVTKETLIEKDLAIISSKLDALQARLESIEQRIERIQRIAEGA